MIDLDLEKWLAGTTELETIERALIRERVIRNVMASTGEDRRTIIDFLDAHRSMDQEAVLDLTDGEPTTLHDALARYAEGLEEEDGRSSDPVELGPYAMSVVDALAKLLAYPWPVVTVQDEDEPNSEWILLMLGDRQVARINASHEGASVAEEVAQAVCRALRD